jgi:hypothetical protein
MAKAFQAAEVLGIASERAHVHTGVELLPEGVRASEPQSVFLFLDFYRRINILAELIEVAEGRALKNGRSFGYLSADGVEFAADDLDDFFNGQEFHDRHPMVAIALRLGIYDDPDLGGLEVRTARRERGALVNLAQRAVMTGNYGPRTDLATAWYEEHRDAGTGGALAGQLHYNRWDPDFPIDDETRRTLMSRSLVNHQGVFMFLHDWSKDWVFGEDPEALERATMVTLRYRQAHFEALREGSLNPEGVRQMVQDYVHESGLLAVFARSLGTTLEELDIQAPKERAARPGDDDSGASWFVQKRPLVNAPQSQEQPSSTEAPEASSDIPFRERRYVRNVRRLS